MANTFGHPDTCSRLLRILGPEQADALLARGQRWHPISEWHDASQLRLSIVPRTVGRPHLNVY
jgi:hypothetical protein